MHRLLPSQETWDSLLASSSFNDQESFAVVFQPFFYEVSSPVVSELQARPRVQTRGAWTMHWLSQNPKSSPALQNLDT